MKTLKETSVGETVKVVKLNGSGPVKRRIMDMGITKGVDVFVRKVAPLGDPVEVTVRGYELSLRKADAEMIEVEEIFFTYLLANSNKCKLKQIKVRLAISNKISKNQRKRGMGKWQLKLHSQEIQTAVKPHCSMH